MESFRPPRRLDFPAILLNSPHGSVRLHTIRKMTGNVADMSPLFVSTVVVVDNDTMGVKFDFLGDKVLCDYCQTGQIHVAFMV